MQFIISLFIFIFVNGFFSLTAFLFPTLPIDKIFPLQLWVNALLLFSLILPKHTASFLQSM